MFDDFFSSVDDSGSTSDTGADQSVSYRDRLTYSHTLQRCANKCIMSRTLEELEINTEAFQIALYFRVEGLPFRDEIDKFLPELNVMSNEYLTKKIVDIRLRDPTHPYYHPKVWDDLRNIDRCRVSKQSRLYYAKQKLIFLLNLLARYEALMSAKDRLEVGSRDEAPMSTPERKAYVDKLVSQIKRL